MEKLDELIKDDDKIVTVSTLAQEAHITLQQAHKTLKKYTETHKDVHSTHILSGIDKTTNKFTVIQCKHDDLQQERANFKGDIIEVVYSIQKSKNIDYNLISQVRCSGAPQGAVVGKNCIKRTLKKKTLPEVPAATVKTKASALFKNVPKKSESDVNSDKKETTNSEIKEKGAEKEKTKPNSVMSMFKNVPVKKSPDKTKVKSGGIAGFFNKAPVKKTENNTKNEDIPTKPKTETIAPKAKKQPGSPAPKKPKLDKSQDLFDSDTDDEPVKPQKPSKTSRKSSKKPDSTKKRKRIIVEDSDSDDMFASEKPSEPSDIEEPPVEEAPKPVPGKTRRRKAVKKTYEDEEGFIVTKMEYVMETDSEAENEPDNKIAKIEEQKVKKAKSPPKKPQVKSGQPTLMSFFTKK